jgi:hypothetical protein
MANNWNGVFEELLKFHENKKKVCMNCECSHINSKYTRYIFEEMYMFCSEWCQHDMEDDIRRNYRRRQM